MLDLADRLISKAGPFAAAGIMVGSIYWTAVTYGAVTVMQVRQPRILGFGGMFFSLYLHGGAERPEKPVSTFDCQPKQNHSDDDSI